MDRTQASKRIMELFIQAVHLYNSIEKIPVKVGTRHVIYHSERHFMDKIGDHPDMNVTDFAKAVGVTKGAVSQIVKKLESKGLIKRFKSNDNDKEVFLELTGAGRDIYIKHKKTNDETIKPLIEILMKHSDEEVEFLISMFQWINGYLEQGGEQMQKRTGKSS